MPDIITTKDPARELSREQIELLKDTICKGASDAELALFVATTNRLRLDPFARQIFAVWRWDPELKRKVMQAQVSIDGFRLVAERTGEYRGQTPPQWCGWDGKWRDVWLEEEPPAAARIGVYRAGFADPLYRVATFQSYVQLTKQGEPNKTWRTMPDVMISKCAESVALRAAFPNDLSGVYTAEEMGQADNPPAEPVTRTRAPEVIDVPCNVVQLPTAAERAQQTGSIVEMLGPKLRSLDTELQLAGWWLEVCGHQPEEPVRKALWGLLGARTRAIGLDRNVVRTRYEDMKNAQQNEVSP